MKRSGLMAGASLFKNCIQHFYACTGFQICYSNDTMISIDLSLLGRYINYSQHQLQWYTETYMNQQMPLTSLNTSKTNKHGQSLKIIRQGTQWNNSWRNPNILSCPCSTAGTPCRGSVAIAFFSHVADGGPSKPSPGMVKLSETAGKKRKKPHSAKIWFDGNDGNDEHLVSISIFNEEMEWSAWVIGSRSLDKLEMGQSLDFQFRSWSSESETDISCGFWNILKHWLIFTSCTLPCVLIQSVLWPSSSASMSSCRWFRWSSQRLLRGKKKHQKYKINRVLSNK